MHRESSALVRGVRVVVLFAIASPLALRNSAPSRSRPRATPPRRRRSSRASRISTASSSMKPPSRSSARRRPTPTFAMAYWGEAMSHNHPLWAQQDAESREGDPREDRADLGRASGQGEAAEGEGVPEGDRHPVLLAGRQAGARHRVLGRAGGDVRAVAGRSRGGHLVCAVAARHGAAHRQGLPPSGARGIDRREGVQGKPEASRRRALHHSRVRRSRSRAAGAATPRARTRASRRPPRTRSICRRTSSCSAACGTTSASRTSSPTSRRPSSTRA